MAPGLLVFVYRLWSARNERNVGCHDRPSARRSAQIAFGGELLNRKRDRVAGDIQRLRQIATRWKALARRQASARDQRSQLVRELTQKRLVAAGGQMDHSR
jgi:hypothetical protein